MIAIGGLILVILGFTVTPIIDNQNDILNDILIDEYYRIQQDYNDYTKITLKF